MDILKLRYLRIVAIVLAVAACSGVESQTRPDPAAVEAARAELRASEAAHRRMRADFEGLRADGRLSQREQDDYRAYLDGLSLLIEEQRERLAALESGRTGSGSGPAGGGLTPDEEVAAMDADLGASLATFDQMLLRKAEEAKNRERRRSPDGGGASGGAAGQSGQSGQSAASGSDGSQGGEAESGQQTAAAEGAAGAAGEGGEPASGTTRGEQQGSARGGTFEGGSGAGGSVPESVAAAGKSPGEGQGRSVPEDIPDGRDDDVVARQLREAAMSETDPELREKLWDEYRRYKRQGG